MFQPNTSLDDFIFSLEMIRDPAHLIASPDTQ
jgi:hypothetical protein